MEVNPEEADYSTEVDGRTYYFCSASCKESFDPEEANTTTREQATSMSGRRSLADEQWKEWGMLRDEIAIGFFFAGLVAGFIPQNVWTSVFSGPVFGLPVYVSWTAVVGAVIGVATFVCSVGNVPFATGLFLFLFWLHRSGPTEEGGHGATPRRPTDSAGSQRAEPPRNRSSNWWVRPGRTWPGRCRQQRHHASLR